MSRTSNQGGSNNSKGMPQSCQHVEQAKSPEGQLLGSWIEIEIDTVIYTACNFCGVRFGKHDLSDKEAGRRAYLEQQRRLACPGCGEEPFLG